MFILSAVFASAQEQRGTKIISQTGISEGATYAVIIGVSEYKYLPAERQLTYADDDAILFYKYLFQKYGKNFGDNLKLITNKEATSINIKQNINNLIEESQQGDKLIIYFAGHGDVYSDSAKNIDDAFLLCHEVTTDADYSISDAISLKSLQELIATGLKKGLNILLITDACRSGKYATTQQAAYSTAKILAEKWNKITRISSCQEDEVSYEDMKWGGGHGAFTYYFVEGLKGNAKNNRDSLIRLADLENYVGRMLVEATDYKQNPVVQGDKKMIISKIDTINYSKSVNIETLLASRASQNENLTKDSSLNKKIENFIKLIDSRKLIEPKGDCAYDLYKEIAVIHEAKKIIRKIKGTLVVALQVDAQKIIDIYLSGSANQPSSEAFAFAAKELDIAISIMGKNNAISKQLLPKQIFLEGFSIVRGEERPRYKEAEKKLKTSLRLSKKSSYVYNGLGRLYLELDKLKESEKYLKCAIEKAPRWTLPKSNLGLVYRRKNLWKDAINIINQTIIIDTSFSWGYNNIACVYLDMGRYRESEIFFKKACQLFPNDPIPISNLGVVAKNQGRDEDAKKYYFEALKVDSIGVVPYQNLGNYYNECEKNPELAEKYLKIAITKEPFFAETYSGLANFYREYDINTIQYKSALSLYLKAVDLNPFNPDIYSDLGYYYFKLGDTNMARKTILLGIKRNKKSALPYNYLANYYKWVKDTVNAEKAYLKALKTDSLCIWTYKWLGDFYENNKQFEKAEIIKRKATCVFPDSPDLTFKLANLFFNKNETDSAIRWYEKTISADPNYSYAYSSLAYIYLFKKNDPQKSLSNFGIARQLNPIKHDPQKFAELLKSKGDSITITGRKKAIYYYKSAIELDSSNMSFLLSLGKAYYLDQQTGEAISILQKGINNINLSIMMRRMFLDIYARVLIDAGENQKALEIFNGLINNNPLPSFLGKAIALYASGDFENAKVFFQNENDDNPNLLSNAYLEKNYSSNAISIISKLKILIKK
jgi:tetratricopeptide (TPR) repeat protein